MYKKTYIFLIVIFITVMSGLTASAEVYWNYRFIELKDMNADYRMHVNLTESNSGIKDSSKVSAKLVGPNGEEIPLTRKYRASTYEWQFAIEKDKLPVSGVYTMYINYTGVEKKITTLNLEKGNEQVKEIVYWNYRFKELRDMSTDYRMYVNLTESNSGIKDSNNVSAKLIGPNGEEVSLTRKYRASTYEWQFAIEKDKLPVSGYYKMYIDYGNLEKQITVLSLSKIINEPEIAKTNTAKIAEQIIAVKHTSGSYAKIEVYEKVNGIWKTVFTTTGRTGKNGVTYDKREGDGKSPVGVFTMSKGFGIANNPGTNYLPYTVLGPNDYWVDDPNSQYYNMWMKGPADGRWNSAEALYNYKEAYKYATVIDYNTERIPYKGSAIFLHVSTDGPTSGCISLDENSLVKIMKWINPSKARIIIAPENDIMNF